MACLSWGESNAVAGSTVWGGAGGGAQSRGGPMGEGHIPDQSGRRGPAARASRPRYPVGPCWWCRHARPVPFHTGPRSSPLLRSVGAASLQSPGPRRSCLRGCQSCQTQRNMLHQSDAMLAATLLFHALLLLGGRGGASAAFSALVRWTHLWNELSEPRMDFTGAPPYMPLVCKMVATSSACVPHSKPVPPARARSGQWSIAWAAAFRAHSVSTGARARGAASTAAQSRGSCARTTVVRGAAVDGRGAPPPLYA